MVHELSSLNHNFPQRFSYSVLLLILPHNQARGKVRRGTDSSIPDLREYSQRKASPNNHREHLESLRRGSPATVDKLWGMRAGMALTQAGRQAGQEAIPVTGGRVIGRGHLQN